MDATWKVVVEITPCFIRPMWHKMLFDPLLLRAWRALEHTGICCEPPPVIIRILERNGVKSVAKSSTGAASLGSPLTVSTPPGDGADHQIADQAACPMAAEELFDLVAMLDATDPAFNWTSWLESTFLAAPGSDSAVSLLA